MWIFFVFHNWKWERECRQETVGVQVEESSRGGIPYRSEGETLLEDGEVASNVKRGRQGGEREDSRHSSVGEPRGCGGHSMESGALV